MLDKIKNWFNFSGKPETVGYNPGPSALIYANWHRRPPWSYFYADIQLLDPQVWFGLNIGNGPLLSAKVTLKPGPKLKSRSDSQEIQTFIARQWDRFWSTSAAQILRAKHYGFLGYEVVCQECDGRIEFAYLRDFHPLDVGQLKSNGARVGIRVRNIQLHGPGAVELYGPKGLWITYGDEFSRTWGRAILERCYQPWFDKNSDGGALDLRRLRNFKDAWIGDIIRYPMKQFRTPNGQFVSGRDLAREIGENRASGAPVFLPSTRDQGGNYDWDYTGPQSVAGDTKIPEWIGDLDWDILDGLLVPREVVEASTTGSGFSGRSVPLIGFLAVRDLEWGHDVRQIKQQVMGPLALVNYGDGADDFDLEPIPLIETVGAQMGEMGRPDVNEPHDKPGGDGQPTAMGDGRAPPTAQQANAPTMQFGGTLWDEDDHPRKIGINADDIPSLVGASHNAKVHMEDLAHDLSNEEMEAMERSFDAFVAEKIATNSAHRNQFSIADPPSRDGATSKGAQDKLDAAAAAPVLAAEVRRRLDKLLKKND